MDTLTVTANMPSRTNKLYNIKGILKDATPAFGAKGPYFLLHMVRASNGEEVTVTAFTKGYDNIATALKSGEIVVGQECKLYGFMRNRRSFLALGVSPARPAQETVSEMEMAA